MFSRPRNHEPIPWRHGTITTPLYTAATVYAAGVGLGVTEGLGATMPVGWMAIGSVTGIIAASASRWIRTRYTSEHETGTGRRVFHTAFTTTWTTAAYAWITWTATGTPWSMASAAAITIGTAALGPAYAVDRYLRNDVIAAQWADEARQHAPADSNEWEQLFQDVGARGVQVLDPVDTRGGYALRLHLTITPYEQILPLLRMLEVRKGDLRSGALDLRPGDSGIATDAILQVSTRDVLAESIDLPADAHPLTITQPLTLGDLESGEPLEILFRQNSVFIAGKKGSGKSVLLHVIISLITRCTDAVIWMIDLAEGNTAKRWLRPWGEQWTDARGRLIDRPILDWVATSPEEAIRLIEASVAVADGRARRMKGGKIRPTSKQPALIVITDENPELVSKYPAAVIAKTSGIKKGRKAAVDYIDAAQRGTGPNTGGGEINSQYDTVIGGRFPKRQEGQFVFPDYYQRVDLSKLPGNGSFFVLDEKRSKGAGPERFKAYFAFDDDEYPDGTPATVIEELSVERWDIRPDLEAEAQKDAEAYGYADRWTDPDRVAWFLDALGQPTPTGWTPNRTAPSHTSPTGPSSATTATETLAPLPSLDSYAERYKDWKPAEHAEPATATAPADPEVEKAIADALAEFERINEQAAVEQIQPKKKDRRHPRRDQVTDWVRDAEDGITVADVRARLAALYPDEKPPSDTAVQNWFAAHPNIDRADRGLYVWTDDPTPGE